MLMAALHLEKPRHPCEHQACDCTNDELFGVFWTAKLNDWSVIDGTRKSL
jgi:hypothetical protein